jgi:ABC-type Fe3+/spermidine/putrescine transport system ATPase subunit
MLELSGIRKSYAEGKAVPRWLADRLSLRVPTGATVAILGPSGGGKSTLLKMIAGLEAPDSGTVRFDGGDVTFERPECRRFALMFQDFALFPNMNVQDNVAFGLVEQGLKKAEARDRANQMLVRFGLGAQVHARTWTLSGGEQQRVALARALITRPRLLLLDEPFSSLDTDLKLALRQEFLTHINEAHITTILVTHDETEARAMAQTAYRLESGHLHWLWGHQSGL